MQRELWGTTCALKQERDYLIGAYVVLETDCLPLLGMIANCDTPDIAMLRWIAFIRMLNPELKHIAGKDNHVADMLSRTRFKGQDNEGGKSLVQMHNVMECASKEVTRLEFREEQYEEELLEIGRCLSTLCKEEDWSPEKFEKI